MLSTFLITHLGSPEWNVCYKDVIAPNGGQKETSVEGMSSVLLHLRCFWSSLERNIKQCQSACCQIVYHQRQVSLSEVSHYIQ